MEDNFLKLAVLSSNYIIPSIFDEVVYFKKYAKSIIYEKYGSYHIFHHYILILQLTSVVLFELKGC